MPCVLFNPSPELTQVLLERLNSPNYSLTQIAADHDTTLEALVLWTTRPDIAERQRAIKSFAAERARSAAVSQLHVCVEALATTLHAYMKDELNLRPAHDSESAHTRDRLRTGARRASWHIQRIARDHPELVPAALLNIIPAREQPRADSPLRRLPPQAPDLSQLSALFAAFLAHSGMSGMGFSESRRGDQPMSTPSTPPSSPPPSLQPEGLEGSRRGLSDESVRSDTPGTLGVIPATLNGSHPAAPADGDPATPSTPTHSATAPLDHSATSLPSTSATEILSSRSFSDTPLTDPHGPNLAHSAANYRGSDPAVAFTDPYVIPQRHIDRLEKAGRRRPEHNQARNEPAAATTGPAP